MKTAVGVSALAPSMQALHVQTTISHRGGGAPLRPRLRAFRGLAPAGPRTGAGGPLGGRPGGAPASARRRATAVRVSALFEKFTEGSVKAVMLAQELCRGCGGAEVGPEHLLLGLVTEGGKQPGGFLGSGITEDRARAVAQAMDGREGARPPAPRDVPFSDDAKRCFEAALLESRRGGSSFIAPEHVFLAVLAVGGPPAEAAAAALGLDTDAAAEEAVRRLKGEAESEGREPPRREAVGAAARGGGGRAGRGDGESDTPVLDEYCRDLVALAAAKKTDPVIGRDKEVARVAQILARRSKNNPILLGEPGVGKTAIAEGLAHAIATGAPVGGAPLPEFLRAKRVLALDVGLLMAGSKERGELESRVTKLLAECKASEGRVVLVIDEIHTVVGAGAVGRGGSGGGGGLDIANLLKPALARGELQCIGATTLDEHRKYIEKDAALERRFQPVLVAEPTQAQALAVLAGLRDRYERHHRVAFTEEALEAAVALSARYVADRQLPDKAIDLIDEAGSRARIAAFNARRAAAAADDAAAAAAGGGAGAAAAAAARAAGAEAAATAWRELTQVVDAKDEAARDGLYEEAALLRRREADLLAQLAGPPGAPATVVPVVGADDVAAVVSAWTGIPVERLGDEERARLAGLAGRLAGRVVGQAEATAAAARAVQRAAGGLRNPGRPVAALFFAGPTGVGKTELAKALAAEHYGDEGAIVRLDMSEYMERHTVAKLIGSPPGYVGYGEGGALTEAVRRRPHCVVLFDEVEKAHPDVFNALLQVLEDGRLTDSGGRVVSFKHALIVLTSNVGSTVIARGGGGLGFQLDADGGGGEQGGAAYARVRSLVLEELKAFFRPELLNRLDEVVVFRRLGRAEARRIADLELAKTAARAAERGVGLRVSAAAMERLCAEGFDEAMGARELRRAVVRLVDDALSDAMLAGEVRDGDVALIDVVGGRVRAVNAARAPAPAAGAPAVEVAYASA